MSDSLLEKLREKIVDSLYYSVLDDGSVILNILMKFDSKVEVSIIKVDSLDKLDKTVENIVELFVESLEPVLTVPKSFKDTLKKYRDKI